MANFDFLTSASKAVRDKIYSAGRSVKDKVADLIDLSALTKKQEPILKQWADASKAQKPQPMVFKVGEGLQKGSVIAPGPTKQRLALPADEPVTFSTDPSKQRLSQNAQAKNTIDTFVQRGQEERAKGYTPAFADLPTKEKVKQVAAAPVRWTAGSLARLVTGAGLEYAKSDLIFDPAKTESNWSDLLVGPEPIKRLSESSLTYGITKEKMLAAGFKPEFANNTGFATAMMVGLFIENPFLAGTGTGAKKLFSKAVTESIEKEVGQKLERSMVAKIAAKSNDIYNLASKEERALRVRSLVNEIKGDLGQAKKVVTIKQPFTDFPDLSTKVLGKLEGKTTVSKQFISDLTNSGELKQAERDLIRSKLLDVEGDTVDVADFANKVKGDLIPLKRVTRPNDIMNGEANRYESITLPSAVRGDVANYSEHIYESPIKTGAANYHFSGDTDKYFAHTRVEDMADNSTRRVIELQSDLMQKGHLADEAKFNGQLFKQLEPKMTPEEIKEIEGYSIKKGNLELTPKEDARWNQILSDAKARFESESAQRLKPLQPYENTWHERLIREEIQQAAKDGKKVLQFPTGKTAMDVEGLGRDDGWFRRNPDASANENWLSVKPDNIKVGEQISDKNYDVWYVTEVLENGQFKAVPAIAFDNSGVKKSIRNFEDLKNGSFSDSIETFDISGKANQENPIYKFYEKDIQKYLKRTRPEMERVTDANGVEWFQVPIKPQDGMKPVHAYGAIAGVEQDDEGNIQFDPVKAGLGMFALGTVEKLRSKLPISFQSKAAVIADRVENDVIKPLQRALGKKQAQEWKLARSWTNIATKMETQGAVDVADNATLFNFFDNPDQYPLPPELQQKLGPQLVNDIKQFKQTLTKEQVDRGLLSSTIDDDEYMRTFLQNADGTPPTAKQLDALQKGTSPSLQKRLFGITQTEGVSGLSTKNRYDQMRVFSNADARDEYLQQFGLQTNRNFLDVMRRTVKQVSDTTSNYDFISSVRAQAKEALPGVREVYDPIVFKQFREDTYNKLANLRDTVLSEARRVKLLGDEEYAIAKESTKDVIDSLKTVVRDDLDIPTDLRAAQLQALNQEFDSARQFMFGDIKENKEAITKEAQSYINALKAEAEGKVTTEVDKIASRFAELSDEGYRKPKNVQIAQKLTGLVFDKNTAKALENVFEVTKPSNIDQFIKGVKLVQATGDLFQVPEVIRQRLATSGVKGLFLPWRYGEREFYERGVSAVEHGLNLGKSADIDIELAKKMGALPESKDIEKTFLESFVDKTGEVLGKIPGASKAGEVTADAFKALEKFQYETLVPYTKLSVYENTWPKMRKSYPNLSPEEAKTLAAQFTNDMFQGINWDRVIAGGADIGGVQMNKRIMRGLRVGFFGPDRLASVARRYTKGFGQYGNEYRKFWIRSAVAGATMLESLNYAFNGHSTFENVDGNELELQIPFLTDDKGNPMSINVLGTWAEPIKALMKPKGYLANKEGTLARIFGIGQSDFFAPKTFAEKIWQTAPLPFTATNLVNQALQDPNDPQTGDTGLPTALAQTGLEFSGLPATFRSGNNPEATLADLITGDATFYEYLASLPMSRGSTNGVGDSSFDPLDDFDIIDGNTLPQDPDEAFDLMEYVDDEEE